MESKAVFEGYVYQKPKINWTNINDLKRELKKVDLSKTIDLEEGGIPVMSNGKTAFIDTSDSHFMLYGASGFGKSLFCFMPLICVLAMANENMVITDPKGELYTRTANFLNNKGYNIRVINLRDYDSDGYNPLRYPLKLYRQGEKDKACTLASNVIGALAQRQESHGSIDPFWPDTAKAYDNGLLPLLMDSYEDEDSVNFLSLADYYTNDTAELLSRYIYDKYSRLNTVNAAITNLKTVLAEPEKTKMSTLSTCSSFVQPFIQNDKLARMMSNSTFEIEEICEEKTALYIVTDDTTTICNPIVEVLISQIQTYAVDKAFRSKNGKLKHRLNFVLDELCSYHICNLNEALATHRSRNIRYYLCVQSLDLLEKKYKNYKSLQTNCSTTLFLGSTEKELLKDISKRCGTTNITENGEKEPLVSIEELMTLKKSWYSKEVVYLNLKDNIRFVSELPSIEKYEMFCKGVAKIPKKKHPPVRVYTFRHLLSDISNNRATIPFVECFLEQQKIEKNKIPKDTTISDDLHRELEAKWDELFGSCEED